MLLFSQLEEYQKQSLLRGCERLSGAEPECQVGAILISLVESRTRDAAFRHGSEQLAQPEWL
jgi:hypothetical protein